VLATFWLVVAMRLEHGKADRTSVVVAFAGTVSAVLSGIELFIFPLLVIYGVLALYVLKKRKTKFYVLFNARNYNALLFTIALVTAWSVTQTVILTKPITYISLIDQPLVSAILVLSLWVCAIPFVHSFSWALKKPRRRRTV